MTVLIAASVVAVVLYGLAGLAHYMMRRNRHLYHEAADRGGRGHFGDGCGRPVIQPFYRPEVKAALEEVLYRDDLFEMWTGVRGFALFLAPIALAVALGVLSVRMDQPPVLPLLVFIGGFALWAMTPRMYLYRLY